MDECLTAPCLKRLPVTARLTTVRVKLILYVPPLAHEIEQIGMQLMTLIHIQPASRFIRVTPPIRQTPSRIASCKNSRRSCNNMINNALNGIQSVFTEFRAIGLTSAQLLR